MRETTMVYNFTHTKYEKMDKASEIKEGKLTDKDGNEIIIDNGLTPNQHTRAVEILSRYRPVSYTHLTLPTIYSV